MVTKIMSIGLNGVKGYRVQVEVQIEYRGNRSFYHCWFAKCLCERVKGAGDGCIAFFMLIDNSEHSCNNFT